MRRAVIDEVVAGVPVRRYRSTGHGVVLVWAHGGGFSGGDLDMPEAHDVARAVAEAGHEVLTVDYRLVGPGISYPAPQDDVAAVLRAVMREVTDRPVVAGGASAGGTLVAGAVARLGAEGRAPDGVVLAYPLVHRVVPAPAPELRLEGLPPAARFGADRVAEIIAAFAPVGSDDGWAFVGDAPPRTFPPTLVLLAELDDLRPSGERFAADLVAAGVRVALHEEPGALHGHLNEPGTARFGRTLAVLIAWLDAATDRRRDESRA